MLWAEFDDPYKNIIR